MTFEKFYINPIVKYVAVAGLLTGLTFPLLNTTKKINILAKIDSVVDVDGNYDASTSEWGVVYNTLGIQNTGRNGEDLELSQLEKYLEMKETD